MTERSDIVATDPDFRVHVVAQAIELFAENGYESTTVEQIAAAAGISRRTFFRQFRAKEDVIFADHESLLEHVSEFLGHSAESSDPWATVCDAAGVVFARFSEHRDLSYRRYQVVQQAEALREREILTGYRYERLFVDYLRPALPHESVLRVVGFAAAVTACHNHLLRGMIKGDADATAEALDQALLEVRRTYGVAPGSARPGDDDEVVVLRYRAGTPVDSITKSLRAQWNQDTPEA
ncbi:MAG: TetR family transcriptional regulator [Rhodococcus sp.]|nr:TetR family transcriptional regulator [Rhodococcus sp. (in: high G+C Gram-positive bacteria)]